MTDRGPLQLPCSGLCFLLWVLPSVRPRRRGYVVFRASVRAVVVAKTMLQHAALINLFGFYTSFWDFFSVGPPVPQTPHTQTHILNMYMCVWINYIDNKIASRQTYSVIIDKIWILLLLPPAHPGGKSEQDAACSCCASRLNRRLFSSYGRLWVFKKKQLLAALKGSAHTGLSEKLRVRRHQVAIVGSLDWSAAWKKKQFPLIFILSAR